MGEIYPSTCDMLKLFARRENVFCMHVPIFRAFGHEKEQILV